ncbi:DUF6199 family natural product biosynthesis protein [Paenibacillus physcomitrellae]|uniref:DUF6199 domain-containing protein n=1 Tax=Paenibacillus physcomitrellae TaxID=1619311 RepID=A0ABQ1FM66_9BACL|nr:DUF6199 family natural product biosynthesis protein [Paenibacillus physcomitrellae]GGA21135.1 hypothetical protein GCM10010917_02320 [Paenibacillus physcomitrellae]
MIGMAIFDMILGVIILGLGILMIVKPTLGWYQQQWRFKEDISEPSDTYISSRKLLGIIILLVGLIFIAGGIMNCF